MVDDQLRYDRMVERALRGVVRQVLDNVAEAGLPGDHHFYLTFATDSPGVVMPGFLREQYPEEMTIVLQHQFFGLDVDDEGFSVTLTFNNHHERLAIPFAAVTTFADPSVNFALQFQPMAEGMEELEPLGDVGMVTGIGQPPMATGTGKVVTLDQFRKK